MCDAVFYYLTIKQVAMLLVLVVLVLVLFWYWLKPKYSHWNDRGIPGPTPWPLFGNIGWHLLGRCTLGEAIRDIYKKYEEYPFVGFYRATNPVLLIRDPELVNRVLVKDFKSFRYNEFTVEQDSDILMKNNPFVQRDEAWKNIRQMLTPGLTSGKMRNQFPLLKQISERFVKYIENHPTATTDGIETRALTKRLTIDNVAKTTFGVDGKSFESYEDISEFNKLANKFLSPGTFLTLVMSAMAVFPWLSYLMTFKSLSGNPDADLVKIVSEVIKHRKENKVEANDYLQFLIDLGKEHNWSNFEVTSHASTVFMDGYETSSLVLSFLLLNLAEHPVYQEKIRDDIRKYEKENQGELTYEAIHEMPWLNACFYESLRYRPPVDFITKLCTETFECTSNNPDFKPLSVTLKPDDVVALPYSMLGKDSKYFENPDQFIPERMLNKDSFQKNAFYPFGDGPRACIGKRFGLMQIKLGAVSILKHFELSVSPKLQKPIKYCRIGFLNEVAGGYWIRYKKIEI